MHTFYLASLFVEDEYFKLSLFLFLKSLKDWGIKGADSDYSHESFGKPQV